MPFISPFPLDRELLAARGLILTPITSAEKTFCGVGVWPPDFRVMRVKAQSLAETALRPNGNREKQSSRTSALPRIKVTGTASHRQRGNHPWKPLHSSMIAPRSENHESPDLLHSHPKINHASSSSILDCRDGWVLRGHGGAKGLTASLGKQ